MLKSISKLKKGDKVAILSPSAGIASLYPWVFDLGLERLEDLFGFEIIEYPTTRQLGSSLRDRAKDIMDAFKNHEIKAVFTAIGGNDQIQLLKYLDGNIIKSNPKPFFGYSDNTHLHNYLWKLGIPTYYGGAIMTQFAMPTNMDELTVISLKNAVDRIQDVLIEPSNYFTEVDLDWADKVNLRKTKLRQKNDGFLWDITSEEKVSGKLWGGCVESMVMLLGANHGPNRTDLQGAILFLETSESIPEPWVIRYVLIALGERGLLKNFSAVLFGRAKAWNLNRQLTLEKRNSYRKEQQKIVVSTIRQYNKHAPIIQNMDFGHTDPQSIIPSGGIATIDPKQKLIWFDY